MQATRANLIPKTHPPIARVDHAVAPPGAAPEFSVEEPVPPRAEDHFELHQLLANESPVGPDFEPDANAQRKRDKKARQAQRPQKPRLSPAERVRQAWESRTPEADALARFIVNHFAQRLLPLTDDAWRVISDWVGFSQLNAATQQLARDFGQLTADERNASGLMLQVQDARHALRHDVARARQPEQKSPEHKRQDQKSPEHQKPGIAAGGQQAVAPADPHVQPLVVHLPAPDLQEPAPSQIAQAAQPELTPLQKYLKQESTRPGDANALVEFVARHLAKGGAAKPGVSEIGRWPGFDQLERNVRRLGDAYCRLTPEDKAQTQLHRKLALHPSLCKVGVPARAVVGEPEASLASRIARKQRMAQALQNEHLNFCRAMAQIEEAMDSASIELADRGLRAVQEELKAGGGPIEKSSNYRKLSVPQRTWAAMQAKLVVHSEAVRQAFFHEVDEFLGELPAQKQEVMKRDEAFAAELMSNPSAASAMKQFLSATIPPNVAMGEVFSTLPGAKAQSPEVVRLLGLADELMVHARVLGQLLLAQKKQLFLLSQAAPAERSPNDGRAPTPTRESELVRFLVDDELARGTHSSAAFSMMVHEARYPLSAIALKGVGQASENSKLFNKANRSEQLLWQFRDGCVDAARKMEFSFARSQGFLLRLYT